MKTDAGNHLCEPLSHQRQAELCRRMRQGDNTPTVAVRNGEIRLVSPRDGLVLSNMRGVFGLAVSTFPAARDDEATRQDLLQAGAVGLLKAIDRWDPPRGKLTTYSYWPARWEMQKVIAGLRPVSRSKWKHPIISVALDATDEDGQCLADTIAAPETVDRVHEQASSDAGASVMPMLEQCHPTAKMIIEQRIIKNRSWRKVARMASKKLHRRVSVDFCRRVLRDTLAQLRGRLEGKHPTLDLENGQQQLELL